jgi:hypothetical protein
MSQETLILIGREDVESVAQQHADRLRSTDIADTVTSVTYETEPESELADVLSDVRGERTYAVPLCLHTHSRR